MSKKILYIFDCQITRVLKVLNSCLISQMEKRVKLCLKRSCKGDIDNGIKGALKMCATLRCVIRTSNSSKTYINRWLKILILLSFYGIYSRQLEEPMEVGKERVHWWIKAFLHHSEAEQKEFVKLLLVYTHIYNWIITKDMSIRK